MVRQILWVGLIVGCSACSHVSSAKKLPAPDAQTSSTQAATVPAASDASTLPADAAAPDQHAAAGESERLIAAPAGYETVSAARKSLEERSDVQTHANPKGWWIVEIPTEHTIWAFTPDDHPAHPAAVAREAVNEHGVIRIRMAVLCTASKEACDTLIEEFKPLNEEMRKRLQENL